MSTFQIYRYYSEYTAGDNQFTIDVTGGNDFYWTGSFDYYTYDEEHRFNRWRHRMDNWGNLVRSEVNMEVAAPTIFAGDEAIIANNYSSYGYEYIYANREVVLESLSVEDGAEFRAYSGLESTNIDISGDLYVQGSTKTNSMTVTGTTWLNGGALTAYGAETAMLTGTGTIVFLKDCSLGASKESSDKFTIGEGLTLKTAASNGGYDAVFYTDIVNNGCILSDGRNLNVIGLSDELLELENHNLIEAYSSTMTLYYVKLDNMDGGILNASGANLYFNTGTQVKNGILTGAYLNVNGATQMSGVTLDAEGIMTVGNVLTLKDSVTVNGTVR
ncbi:MAG: hypothetical protein IJS08_07265, partial [Victivallales bacterium]|nr:hypothetical protein [Victivallales bacterium]